MLSPRLRRQVSELWTMFWASGMTNPLTAIEQITYLLFLKGLESRDEEDRKRGMRSLYGRRPNCQLEHHPSDSINVDQSLPPGADPSLYEGCTGHGTCRWNYIRQVQTVSDPRTKRDITPHEHLSRFVFPWLRELEQTLARRGADTNGLADAGSRMTDAYFQLAAEKTATLQRAIRMVDDLFREVGRNSASDDLMGDIFEHLLSEIETSGKNGQFRTPRHIIRFMIELIDPWAGGRPERILDPAAGTAGFLINSILHIRKQHTDRDTLLLEWDGTPHRAFGSDPNLDSYFTGHYFAGYDNDRTMVRIGWMNMILHGIVNPQIIQRDSLGKGLPDDESDSYDVILANPPFTGTVDKADLHEGRFPRNPRNTREPITNKSELLFLWLALDLLRVGGRAAIIVPEGVLFGSTGAHRELRRTLLLNNELEAVISLPAGVFQPYTGVKTSILVFRKIGVNVRPGDPPYTGSVWFYEVTADGYTMDAKRDPRPTPNDLWDALYKWPSRSVENERYYQPDFVMQRWRTVDEATGALFPSNPEVRQALDGSYERAIHELFPELPPDPEEATAQVVNAQVERLLDLYGQALNAARSQAAALVARSQPISATPVDKIFRERLRILNNLFAEASRQMLEDGYEDYGRKALAPLLKTVQDTAAVQVEKLVTELMQPMFQPNGLNNLSMTDNQDWTSAVGDIVREFAKLDGYDVRLRTLNSVHEDNRIENTGFTIGESKERPPKSWRVRVRIFARNDEWRSADGILVGSHDSNGLLRPEYRDDTRLYQIDGTVRPEYLDPTCLEANDFNLSAGRYRPLNTTIVPHDPPAEIIRSLQVLEAEIQRGLQSLLLKVEGKEINS